MSREHRTSHESVGHGRATSPDQFGGGPGKRTLTEALPHHEAAGADREGDDELDREADDGDVEASASVALIEGKPPRAERPPEPSQDESSSGAARPVASGADKPVARAARGKRALTLAQAIRRYAPLVHIAVGEEYRPASASEFINNSNLNWSHDSGRGDDEDIVGVGEIDQERLGSGGYSHRTKGLIGGERGDPIPSNADVRPKDGRGDGGNEGFFLNLRNENRKSRKSGTNAPVYHEAVNHHYITYWFFYAFNDGPTQGRADGVDDHEGDWERIVVKLNGNNRATHVAYYQHDGPPKILKWRQVPKANGHPEVFSAKGSHASYASAGAKPIYHEVAGRKVRIATDQASAGRKWHTKNNLVNARDQDWYGYGGAWGEVGALTHTTGPQGPSRHKRPAPEGW
jgi:hypothetical protein